MVLIDSKVPLPDAEQAPPPPSYPQEPSPPPPAQPSRSYVPDPHQYPAYADMGMGPPFNPHCTFLHWPDYNFALMTVTVLARCAQGEHEVTTTFGLCGIICAVLIFPIGLICLWCVCPCHSLSQPLTTLQSGLGEEMLKMWHPHRMSSSSHPSSSSWSFPASW